MTLTTNGSVAEQTMLESEIVDPLPLLKLYQHIYTRIRKAGLLYCFVTAQTIHKHIAEQSVLFDATFEFIKWELIHVQNLQHVVNFVFTLSQ